MIKADLTRLDKRGRLKATRRIQQMVNPPVGLKTTVQDLFGSDHYLATVVEVTDEWIYLEVEWRPTFASFRPTLAVATSTRPFRVSGAAARTGTKSRTWRGR